MSAVTADGQAPGHELPVPLHEHVGDTDCSSTIGAMMMISERA